MNLVWEAFIILTAGFFLIRIVGKKAVSEMTAPDIVTLLSTGSIIGHALSENGLWQTLLTLSIFALLLITVQYLGVKFNGIEKLFMGQATPVIQDGQILIHNLKKLRMTVDQLETKLRERGISSLGEIQTATIEMNGHLGYELTRAAKPVTVGDLENLLGRLTLSQQSPPQPQPVNLFEEVLHQKHQQEIPPELD